MNKKRIWKRYLRKTEEAYQAYLHRENQEGFIVAYHQLYRDQLPAFREAQKALKKLHLERG